MKSLPSINRGRASARIISLLAASILLSGCAASLTEKIENGKRSSALQKIDTANMVDGLEKRDEKGRMPIHIASKKKEDQIVAALIKKGVSPEVTDYSGKTALHYAAEYEAVKVVNVLIRSSANIETKDHNGWTPLVYAAHHPNTSIVSALLRAGARVDARGNRDETALHMACRNFYVRTWRLVDAAARLVGRRLNLPNEVYAQFIDESIAVSRVLLRAGADINARDSNGETPIFEAIRLSRSSKLVKFLVANGADLSVRNNEGQTPLALATALGKANIALQLQRVSSLYPRD